MKSNLLLIVLLIGGFYDTGFAQKVKSTDDVTVITERVGTAYHVTARNNNPYSITLTLSVTGKNYKVDRPLPATAVVRAKGSKILLIVGVVDKTKSFELGNHYSWFMGNIYARHNDSYIYRLPFEKGTAFRVGQAYNGSFSHQGDSKYAIDFIMPEGTQVVAARGGIVVQIREDSDIGGKSYSLRDDANFIVIEHNDGTFGEYAHLKQGGVWVESGERVNRGQVIGLSGNTGFSSGPHLHFMVTKVLPDGHSQSLPVRFNSKRGVVESFIKGESYTAL